MSILYSLFEKNLNDVSNVVNDHSRDTKRTFTDSSHSSPNSFIQDSFIRILSRPGVLGRALSCEAETLSRRKTSVSLLKIVKQVCFEYPSPLRGCVPVGVLLYLVAPLRFGTCSFACASIHSERFFFSHSLLANGSRW